MGTPSGVIEVKRGQFVSGRIELASRLKQTEQQIRTSLKRLEELEIITITSTNKYSVYTIENYSKYQDTDDASNQQDNQQTTNKQPTNNQQTTTKQECKNLNIEEFNKKHTQKNNFFAGIDQQLVSDYLAVRKAKRAPAVSQTVFDGLSREAKLAGISLDQALRVCIERNWVGFKADWYANAKSNSPPQSIADQNKLSTEIARQKLFGNINAEKDITNEARTI